MRKIIYIAMVALVSLGCFSCSDVLDKGPLDKYSENDVWKSTDLTQAFIYTALSHATDMMIWRDNWTDNEAILEDGPTINKELFDRYHDAGWNVYGDIRRCNMVIAKMPDAPFTEVEKKNFIAQAKTIRAMIYFTRARLFGKLMLVKDLVDVNAEMTYPRTATIKETYDFILQDLEEAAPDLPVDASAGALCQGVAYAVLAEAALHGAAYIENGQDSYYEKAVWASEKLFQLGKYSLDSDYKNMFNDFDHSLSSPEIILAQWKSADNTTFQGTWMQRLVPNIANDKLVPDVNLGLVEEFAGWPQRFPSVDLVNDYQVVDADGVARDWDKTSYYQDFLANGGNVSDAIYKNRDKRFDASIVYDGTKFFANTVYLREKGNLYYTSKSTEFWGMPVSGYVYRKCVYESKRLLNTEATNYHYVLLRLGRSYLNYAEAKLRLKDARTAVEYINKTREVHGGLPALPTTLSLADAWKEYKRERRVDLVSEGDRYWTVLRWAKADGLDVVPELTVTQKFMKIAADGKSFEIIDLPIYKDDNERVFTAKRYLFPVPQGERDKNPNLDQNPGWGGDN